MASSHSKWYMFKKFPWSLRWPGTYAPIVYISNLLKLMPRMFLFARSRFYIGLLTLASHRPHPHSWHWLDSRYWCHTSGSFATAWATLRSIDVPRGCNSSKTAESWSQPRSTTIITRPMTEASASAVEPATISLNGSFRMWLLTSGFGQYSSLALLSLMYPSSTTSWLHS